MARLSIQANKLIELKINGPSPLSIQTLIAPSLEILHCSNLADTRSLVGLATLKKLRLNNCQQMRNEDLTQLLTNNPGLKELILNRCSQISQFPDHPGLNFLSLTKIPLVAIKGKYPALTSLHCEGCGHLNEITLPNAPIERLITWRSISIMAIWIHFLNSFREKTHLMYQIWK